MRRVDSGLVFLHSGFGSSFRFAVHLFPYGGSIVIRVQEGKKIGRLPATAAMGSTTRQRRTSLTTGLAAFRGKAKIPTGFTENRGTRTQGANGGILKANRLIKFFAMRGQEGSHSSIHSTREGFIDPQIRIGLSAIPVS